MHLVLIEDDPLIGSGIKEAFNIDGEILDWFQTGLAGFNALKMQAFDVLILDLGLPDLDGLSLVQRIRKEKMAIPILILTARNQVNERVTGLDSGADDYLVKPFDVNELKARVRALIRRFNQQGSPDIKYQDITIDPVSRRVTQAGQGVMLSRREYLLLLEFLSHPKRVFTREQLMEKIYEMGEHLESNAVEVHVHHLRKKFGKEFIKTLRGVGYQLTS